MFRVILYLSFFLVFFQNAFCQVRTVKPVKKTHPRSTKLSIGGGVMRSELFLSRNVKVNNGAYGYQGTLLYGGSNVFRGSLEYTYYRKINIEPTWYNVKAYTIEANAHIIARFKRTKTYFYPLFGLSYNSFSGYFTGLEDYLHLSDRYKKNETAKTNWVGFNVGTGFEQYFKQISIYGEYKLRIGTSAVNGSSQLTIMDVCFNLGLRYTIKVPSVYKIFSGTKNRYVLDSKEVED